ncbi:MAG: tetratricopeptide repeat protein [Acidobacteria bacterium]|nr:tetratricopeptide repeat protein [Acidobacteriota bacterium]MYH21670.1 tetratricopeptide repeat protein [Acidobacteriota bacterium]MYK78276.1 tetratricopeptide repeat protein [Acidobacteriota bacterium]
MSFLAAVSIATALTAAQDPVTFARNVAPILFEHCVACHREGGIGPFSLETYGGARERAERIAALTAARHMPPWLPEPGSESFLGERRLPEEAIATLRRWADGGAPEGNPAALPPVRHFPAGWQLGEPDLVVAMSESYVVPESGRDVFRSFVVPVPTGRDRFVEAMEFRPGNHEVVHHAVVLVDAARSTRHLDALDPEPGWAGMQAGLAESPAGHFLGWTPGKTSLKVPEGMTWRLPRGSDLVLQLHLLPRPDAAPVRVQVGFHFGDAPTRTSTRLRLGTKAMDIPAGDERYRIRDAYRVPVDVELVGLYPHAHYLGKEMRAWAEFEDGRRRPLLHIPDWDFNWQAEYRFARPVSLPAGATLAMEFSYDNSAENPQNPHHPPRRVLYGPESSDEMGDLWIQVVPRREADLAELKLDFARKETAARLAGYRFKLDQNPEDEKAHFGLAGMLAALGERDGAIRHLDEAVRVRPDFALALSDLGRLHFLNGDVDRAVALFSRAIAASPELPQAHHNLGTVRLAQRNPEEAEAHFRRALEEWPEFAEAHYGLGEALEAESQPDEAFEHYRRAVSAKPDFALAHFRLGNLLARSDDGDAAVRHYDAAIAAEPDFVPPRFNRAAVLARQGKADEAALALEQLLELEPDHREARELLSRIDLRTPRRR